MQTEDFTQQELADMWIEFGNVPVNENEDIEVDFLWWPIGTDIMDIWHWFDDKFESGLGKFLERKK
jgi:hypothetical protein